MCSDSFSSLLIYSVLLILAFSHAKPLHKRHESSHINEDIHRRHLAKSADSVISNLLKAHASRSEIRNPAAPLLTPSHDTVKRAKNDNSLIACGSQIWGSQGSRSGNGGGTTNTNLGQLLGEVDSSFQSLLSIVPAPNQISPQLLGELDSSLDALLNFLAAEYHVTPQRPMGTNPDTSSPSPPNPTGPSQDEPSSSTEPPTSPNSPFSTILPIPQISSSLTNPDIGPSTTSSIASTSVTPTTGIAASTAYRFDPLRPDINAVYYAQSPATTSVPLPEICSDLSIDIITLAFVSKFFTAPAGYPTLNLASKCWAPTAAQASTGATGLIDCVSSGFAAQVASCQALGKKVTLSLGGAAGYSDTYIPSEEKAVELAHTLWELFLGGKDNATLQALRPLGPDVVLDGIDIDNETPANSQHLPTLVSTLRSLFSTSESNPKVYYLSAAPQCPQPDASIPIPQLLNNLDFVMPQFYNNPSCDLNTGQAFLDSLQAWSNDVAQVSDFNDIGNGIHSPRLLLGTPADSAAGSGYVDPETYRQILLEVKQLNLSNLGGSMAWDGAYEELSKSGNGGMGFAEMVREVLG